MENNVIIEFVQEQREVKINIDQPDLAKLIHIIVSEHLKVTADNINIHTDNLEFDKEEFLKLLVESYEEFEEEIDEFFINITKEIKTYYDDEELSQRVIAYIRETETKPRED